MEQTLDKISNHLEFLAYTIKKIEPDTEGGRQLILATHSDLHNFLFYEIAQDLLLFRVRLSTDLKISNEMLSFVNKANKSLNIARLYIEEDEDDNLVRIVYEATYMGEYSKNMFSRFFSLYQSDRDRVAGSNEFTDLFVIGK
jgi:hypothetical protein